MKRLNHWVPESLALFLVIFGIPTIDAGAQTAPASAPAIGREYLDFSHKLEAALKAGDAAALQNLMDVDALLEKVTASIPGVPTNKGFQAGFIRAGKSKLIGTLVVAHPPAEMYHLLRVRRVDGNVRVLIRVLQDSGGVNYQDWIVVRAADGTIRATDIDQIASGERYSASLRRLFIRAVVADNAENGTGKQANPSELVAAADDMVKISEALRAKQFEQGLAIYDRLPAAWKQDKLFAIIRLMCLGAIPGRQTEYIRAMADYQKRFAGDPSIYLMCMDGWVSGGDYTAARAGLDKLEVWTGGDAYLVALRGMLLLMENKPDAPAGAEKLAREAVAVEPKLSEARLLLARSLALQGKFDEAVEAIRLCEEMTGVTLHAEELPELKEFAASDAYKRFRSPQPH